MILLKNLKMNSREKFNEINKGRPCNPCRRDVMNRVLSSNSALTTLITRRLVKSRILLPSSLRFISTMTPGHDHTTTNATLLQGRPLSPHVSIYQPQLTWLMSIGHRVTGAGLAGLIYAFGITASATSIDLTAKICELVSAVPLPLVLAGKFALAAPFMYHLLNGVRHLIWDTGKALTLRGVYTTGWIVNITTILSAGLLTIL